MNFRVRMSTDIRHHQEQYQETTLHITSLSNYTATSVCATAAVTVTLSFEACVGTRKIPEVKAQVVAVWIT